jgi:linoleoyl-CoA desaturase
LPAFVESAIDGLNESLRVSGAERRPGGLRQPVRYAPHTALWTELTRRIDAHFAERGLRREGDGRLWLKSLVIMAWLAGSWALLVYVAQTWWQALPLAVLVSLAVAGVGFNIQHDGGHDAYAGSSLWNRLAAWSLDLVGGSSYVWRFKHTIVHHHYTNIDGVDEDLDAGPFLRLHPLQERRFYHRFQHWYAWLLFGFLPPKWTFYDDFASLVSGRVGTQRMPRPRLRDLTSLFVGKLAFVTWVFALPLLAGHSLLVVLAFYGFCALLVGTATAVVFQAAHCVREAEFHAPPPPGARMARSWGEHQLATTVDFAPRNRFLTWYLGGLNYQVEHHLFPRVSHVHYPELAPIVRDTCAEFGVEYRVHPRFRSAVASHVRHLRLLGRPNAAPSAKAS